MNLLNLPWGSKGPVKKQTSATKTSNRPYLGRATEAQISAKGRTAITIELRGLSSRSGSFKVSFTDGQPLKYYLGTLGLTRTATYAAIYDTTHPECGRLRLRYVPKADSIILICPPAYGIASGLQRTQVDVYQLMAGMKG